MYWENSITFAELYKSGERINGVYTIDPDNSGAFDVFCDQTTADGGWTVFRKRLDGSVDFSSRGWPDYKRGFGNLNGEFLWEVIAAKILFQIILCNNNNNNNNNNSK